MASSLCEDDDLNFTTPSSEGLETLSSDDESGSEIIQPLSPFSMPLKARLSPQRANSPDASFKHGGTAVTKNLLSVLSSYRKPNRAGRATGGGRGGGSGMVSPMSDTLPGPHQSRSMGTFESSRETSQIRYEESLEDLMMEDSIEGSIRPIQGFLGVRSGAFSKGDDAGGSSGDINSNGETTTSRCTLNSGTLIPFHTSTRVGAGGGGMMVASSRPFSDGDNRSKSTSKDSSQIMGGSLRTSPRGGVLNHNESFVGLRHVASTIPKPPEASFIASVNMSRDEIRIAEVQHHKQLKKEEDRKAKLMRFLGGGCGKGGGGGTGVVGD